MKKNQERRLHRKNAKIAKEGGTPMTLNRPIKPDTTVKSLSPLFFFSYTAPTAGPFLSFFFPFSFVGNRWTNMSPVQRRCGHCGQMGHMSTPPIQQRKFLFSLTRRHHKNYPLFRNEPQVSTLGGVQHRRAAAINCYTVHTNCGCGSSGVRIRGHTAAVDSQSQQLPWLRPEHLAPRAFTPGDEPTCRCRRARRSCAAGRAQDQAHTETVILAHRTGT